MDVRHLSSMRIKRPSISSRISLKPQPSVCGLRPTVTRTLSASIERVAPSDVVTSSALPSAFMPLAEVLVSTSTPSCFNRAMTGRVSSTSYCGKILSVASTIVTFEPSLAKAVPISSPIYPPPTIASFSGIFSRASASADEMILPPNGNEVISTGTEPVAITIFSAWIVWRPVSVSTSTVLPLMNRACP
ncbi:hypothetical protein FQZ97_879260 [compost metagenome]